MKNRIGLLALVLMLLLSVVPVAAEEPPTLNAETAIVMDASSGYILYQKDMDKKMYPASMTKIMTALLVLEKGNLDDIVTVSQKAVDSVDIYQSSNIGLQVGEEVSVRDLLNALLIPSANDAAYALAEYISSSELDFANLMNERARELGAVNTHFANSSGLHDDDHYTTAHDIALIAREAMKNTTFAQTVSQSTFIFPQTNMRQSKATYANTNHLVSRYLNTSYYYDKSTGIKTGFTDEAKHTLASSAKDGSNSLISVVMGCPDETNGRVTSFVDAKALFEYAFANFTNQSFVAANQMISEYDVPNAKGDGHLLLLTPVSKEGYLPNDLKAEDITFDIHLSRDLRAPIQKGETLGSASVMYNGQSIGTIELQSDRNLEKSAWKSLKLGIVSFFDKVPFLKYILIVLIVLIILLLLFRAYNLRRRRRRRPRRSRYKHYSNKYKRFR